MSDPMEFLLWVRGPAFNVALVIFIAGMLVRLLEIFLLGRRTNYAAPRGGEWGPGLRTMLSRSFADPGILKRAPFNVIVGWIWHLGFLIALFLFIPHIEVVEKSFGLSWPGLPNPLVDAVTAVTIVALLAMLIHRIQHPVMRFLSTPEDYFTWAVTLLPLLTGYVAYHRLIDPYPLALGIHILSIELLMVVFPFTKLTHAVTAFIARWYNGATFGRKGVRA